MASCLDENQRCVCIFSHDYLGPQEHCAPSSDSAQRLPLVQSIGIYHFFFSLCLEHTVVQKN